MGSTKTTMDVLWVGLECFIHSIDILVLNV